MPSWAEKAVPLVVASLDVVAEGRSPNWAETAHSLAVAYLPRWLEKAHSLAATERAAPQDIVAAGR